MWDCRSYSIVINLDPLIYLLCQIRHGIKYVRVYIDPYVCVIYTAPELSWKLSPIHPGIYWNILESHFFIAVRTLIILINII